MNTQKHRILLVEDQKIAQKIALFCLTEQGCDVDTAETGAQALKLFSQSAYDLIFMDLGLDDIDGLTITETIRRMEDERNTPPVPIVVLTAHDAEDIRRNCIDAGVSGFMPKPILPEKSREILATFLRHN